MKARNEVLPFRRRARTIDPKAPLEAAAMFVHDVYTSGSPAIETLVYWQSEFFAWRGSHYARVSRDHLRAKLYEWSSHQVNLEGLAVKPGPRFIDALVDALKAVASINVPSAPAWLVDDVGVTEADPGSHPWITEARAAGLLPLDDYRSPAAGNMLALGNGLLHLPTRRLHPHGPVLFNVNALDFDFDPGARAPAWARFLRDLWGDDQESVEALQEWFALSLTADTSFQKMLMLIGPKRSGKGTIARVWRHLVGAENMSSPTLASLGQHFGLASLIGKRLAIISDARLGGRADLAAIAETMLRVSGEDAVDVPRKFLPDWNGNLGVRFVLLTNELPALLDASGALASRFVLLRLMRSFFGEEDRQLSARLVAELPGILNWALDGLDRLRSNKYLTQPRSAQELVDQLEALASPIKAFIAERCIVEAGAWVECGLLFDAWCQWCHEQHRGHEGTVQIFGRNLGAAVPGVRVVRPRSQGKQRRVYEGIRLRDFSDTEPEARETR